MNEIKTNNRQSFFPQDKKGVTPEKPISDTRFRSKLSKKKDEETIGNFEHDAKVEIPKKVKDFSRIKKAADSAPNVDKSEKIAMLKKQIDAGEYEAHVEEIAKKMLTSEL